MINIAVKVLINLKVCESNYPIINQCMDTLNEFIKVFKLYIN